MYLWFKIESRKKCHSKNKLANDGHVFSTIEMKREIFEEKLVNIICTKL